MMNNRIERIQLSTDFESTLLRQVVEYSIIVSGTIPSGHKQFSVDVPIVRGKAIFQSYVRVGSNNWEVVNASSVIPEIVWDHNVYLWMSQPSENVLRVIIDVDNPTASKTIQTQTAFFKTRVFDAPFS